MSKRVAVPCWRCPDGVVLMSLQDLMGSRRFAEPGVDMLSVCLREAHVHPQNGVFFCL